MQNVENLKEEKQIEIQKELFLATLIHDLKTPLQAQMSSLRSILKGNFGSINEEQKDVLNMIFESQNFMHEMLYSFLTVYKCDNGIIKLNPDNFYLADLVNNSIKEVLSFAAEKNISVEYSTKRELTNISADENLIKRVINNLLNNSINYAYNGTVLFISVKKSNNNVIFRIKNTSDVIPLEIQKNMFDKYSSGYNMNGKIGIGLGLYFCKKVIEAHNGSISLISNSTSNEFVVELPQKSVSKQISELKFT